MVARIQPMDYLHGVKVVDIGDLRVARGMTRREYSRCRHVDIVYDPAERRIWCEDCESDVEPFDAFVSLVERFHHIDAKIERLRETEKHTLFSRAAKAMDEAFRSRNMAPMCPHCNALILPEDVANGVGLGNKGLELRRRTTRGGQ